MNILYKFFSSIITTVVLLALYASAASMATFIENDYGTSVAKYLVYNSWPFNVLHFLLVVNMIVAFFKYKMFEPKRLSMFLFHFAFIVIIIGAAITRFVSYEGSMHIREGDTSNKILTYNSYLKVEINNGESVYKSETPVNFNAISGNKFNDVIDFDNEEFTINLKQVIPNAVENVVAAENGEPIVVFTFLNNNIRNDVTIKYGETKWVGDQLFCFGINPPENAFYLDYVNDTLCFMNNEEVSYSIMRDSVVGKIDAKILSPLLNRFLYTWNTNALVLNKVYPKAKTELRSMGIKNNGGQNALIFDITNNNQTQELLVFGKDSYIGKQNNIKSGKYNIAISYGSKEIELPFSLKLNDFVLEKYPGSSSPAAYESFVTLTDNRYSKVEEHKIFMNNVLEYGGYRFFQSSYDQDEGGTILSVNHDSWGTFLTYLGYTLLTIGMFISLINKNSRFRFLDKKIKEFDMPKTIVLVLGLFLASQFNTKAQSTERLPLIDKSHADKFGQLLVQDKGGRIKPVNTLTNELLRKLTRRSTFNGMNSDQVYISIMLRPDLWARTPIIKIKHPELIKRFNTREDQVALSNVFDKNANYILNNEVKHAYSKGSGKQDMMDKEILKLDERVNILYSTLSGNFLNIFPEKSSENNKWVNVNDVKLDSSNVYMLLSAYLIEVEKAIKSGNWSEADNALSAIANYQEENGKSILINKNKIKAEVFYTKSAIFRHLFEFYFIIGLFYLAYLILIILLPKLNFKYIDLAARVLIYIAFAAHTFGLALRWYISGHAPWSNGYESMIYISWVTMLAGVIFANKNKISLASTTVLGGIVLLIAHLSWIDPEITNLVPVLNSYWLTIHVAVIIASYGFVGLGAILGFVNLVLMIVKTPKNFDRINNNILQLTYINEKSLIIGLYLLTIGTFLGGVWANESWGRYWGWDPKETWALITVVVYAIVVHVRLVPTLKGIFTFNFLSLISFSAVIMTYFGVNYYLTGLHSYASGDPVPMPNVVYYAVIVILIVANVAYFRDKKFEITAE
ncbi:MAG: c-type cytochrome biogenesis protein CcsB [Bacteroidota bacterium]